MEHFIAYHSVQRMGYEFEASGELCFLSRKVGLLNKAIGSTVWVIQGIPNGKKTSYSLCGAYHADSVDIDDSDSGLYVINGKSLKEFVPPVPLGDANWFPALLKSQSNFSIGFNRISDESVIQSLVALLGEDTAPIIPAALPDIDLPATGTEGTTRLVSHLRRERNRSIVEAKKTVTLNNKGALCCEVCGFNFFSTYGSIGAGFCEVHHLVPLSTSSESVTTTLEDLAVLCSNCHRIIHRSSPMLTVKELSKLVVNANP